MSYKLVLTNKFKKGLITLVDTGTHADLFNM